MKPITLHPISVLAGLASAGLAFFATGAAQQPIVARHVPPDVQVVGEIPPEWWTYAHLQTDNGGTVIQSFTVPLNRYFVVTAVRSGAQGTPAQLLADGQQIYEQLFAVDLNALVGPQNLSPSESFDRNDTRVVFPPGTLLTAEQGALGQTVSLWGYLKPL